MIVNVHKEFLTASRAHTPATHIMDTTNNDSSMTNYLRSVCGVRDMAWIREDHNPKTVTCGRCIRLLERTREWQEVKGQRGK